MPAPSLSTQGPAARRDPAHALLEGFVADSPGPRPRELSDVLAALERVEDADLEARVIHALTRCPAADVVPTLLARLEREDRKSVRLAIVVALGRLGDPAAIPALRGQATPDDSSRAAEALLALHSLGAGGAATLADEILRSPDLRQPGPVVFAAATVRGEPLEIVLASLESGAYPDSVRSLAREWLDQRNALAGETPCCGKEKP